MARCCSQWPVVLLLSLGVVLLILQIVSVFAPRYRSSSSQDIAFSLTGYVIRSSGSLCYYNGGRGFFSTQCPSNYFSNSVTGTSLALSFGVIGFLVQITVLVLYIVFLGACCSSSPCDRGVLNAIKSLIFLSFICQLVEICSPQVMKNEMQEYFHTQLQVEGGFILNVITLVVTALMFIFTLIYRGTGARSNKCYDCCGSCEDDYEIVSDKQITVTTIPSSVPVGISYQPNMPGFQMPGMQTNLPLYHQTTSPVYSTYPPVQQVAYTQTQAYPPQQVYYSTQHPEPFKTNYNLQ